MRGKNFTSGEISLMKRLYPSHPREEILGALNRSWISLQSKASELRLRREKEIRYLGASERTREWHKTHASPIAGLKNPMKRPEVREKISSIMSKIVRSKKWGRNISKAKKGTIPSLETRRLWSEQRRGEKHPRFNNWSSREPYDKNWSEDLREQIRRRDGRKCVFCNLEEKFHLALFRRKLAVHHVDGKKKNSKLSNLLSLCYLCHNRVMTYE